jgi:hypothetical protein
MLHPPVRSSPSLFYNRLFCDEAMSERLTAFFFRTTDPWLQTFISTASPDCRRGSHDEAAFSVRAH